MDDTLDFDTYADVLRERLFDYEALHGTSGLPDFHELMSDYDETAPAGWPAQAWEELQAQGHLSQASGRAGSARPGGTVFGLLSADARLYVRQRRSDGDAA